MKHSILTKILAAVMSLLLIFGTLSACGAGDTEQTTSSAQGAQGEQQQTSASEHTKVKFEMENDGKSLGSFTVELYPEYAPITVANFIKLVSDGFYDGLTFHRVIDGFMAQGGDPTGTGTGGSDTIKGEFSANGVDNPLSHTRGVISMARKGNSYDSGSCQFFICYSDNYTGVLDGQYASFGKVIDGMEVVDSFCDIERTTGSDGKASSPVTPIVITSATIVD